MRSASAIEAAEAADATDVVPVFCVARTPRAGAMAVALWLAFAGAARAADRTVLVASEGQRVLEIAQREHGETITITVPGQPALIGEARDSAKRKYRQQQPGRAGAVVAEVKLKSESPGGDPAGFKLRAPDGKPRWKVKIGPEKIKISADDQSGKNAGKNDETRVWVLSLKHADKVKVSDGDDHLLGFVDYHGGKRVAVRDANGRELFDAPSEPRSASFGVLLITAIPMPDRAILMAEILAAGF